MTKTIILLIMVFLSLSVIIVVMLTERLDELKKLVGIIVKSIVSQTKQ